MSTRPAALLPYGAFVQSLRVRSYEVGPGGRIGIGTVLRYLESLATEASASLGFDVRWYEEHRAAWVVRDISIWLGPLPGIGDELLLATWVSDFKRVQAQREYLLRRQDNGRLVARASARWAYVDRLRGQPIRLPDELVSQFPVLGHSLPAASRYTTDPREPAAITSDMLLTARDYETDTQQHINNCVYGDWLTEGLHRALHIDEIAGASRHMHPRAYRIEYVRPVLPGQRIRIETALSSRGTYGQCATQGILRADDGGLCVRAHSAHLRLPTVDAPRM